MFTHFRSIILCGSNSAVLAQAEALVNDLHNEFTHNEEQRLNDAQALNAVDVEQVDEPVVDPDVEIVHDEILREEFGIPLPDSDSDIDTYDDIIDALCEQFSAMVFVPPIDEDQFIICRSHIERIKTNI